MTGIETVALVAMAAGAAVSAYGQIKGGRDTKKAMDRNAQVLERNAVIARQQARAEADTQQREARQRLGAMRAGYGASGVAVEGSPLDALADSAQLAELDRQNLIYNGELKAMGYQDSASGERFAGRNAQTSGYMGAASTILTGAGDIARRTSKPSAPGDSPWAGAYNPANDDYL